MQDFNHDTVTVQEAITHSNEPESKNDQIPEISEANRSAVAKCIDKLRKDGKPVGYKEKTKRLSPRARSFASNIAQGLSPREAYAKAYDVSRRSEASVIADANKLMRDPRISMILEEVWESVQENIVDDAIATRRKIMGDLVKHADNEQARLSDRLKSLELMGRAIGMFTDKSEVKTEVIDAEQLKRDLDKHLAKMH
jgi:hypothetical protein